MGSPATAATRWPPYRVDAEHAAAVESVRAVLTETELEAERLRRLPQRAVAALHSAGLFGVATPKEAGGWDADPLAELQVYEALARINTSAAWVVTTGSVYTSWAAAYLSDDAVAAVFDSGAPAVVAGQAPPKGRATAVPGGLRVSGRYTFGSGMSHASWVLGGFTLAGTEGTWAFIVPKDQVEVLDNWHAVGIAGSNSVDFAVTDLFVPDGHFFNTAKPVPLRGGPRFGVPIVVQVAAAHCGVALGAGQRALDEIIRRAAATPALAERGAFQRDLGQVFTALSAARDHAARLVTELGDRLRSATRLDRQFIQQLIAAQTHATDTAVHAATTAYRYAGAPAVRLADPLQRITRDLLVAGQHKFVADVSYDALGVTLVERDR
ncbi:alkylation response protein AidB-like acyl-CoA dehydrogenase [Actinokineospora baliensis]|uniref:acyl-CoA dehydrogenase family protein n=1 Tax=Actinokineospora baliensis TaxID=547056 RepID=UPI001956A48C|nr:acyl-CoA dehydrogenase family protein [Actinokineospora baliensis]MBM7774528.1 alkylation response protein AidB-like acyl-CoA dehydrogenase [Actinokineospora baliensis]